MPVPSTSPERLVRAAAHVVAAFLLLLLAVWSIGPATALTPEPPSVGSGVADPADTGSLEQARPEASTPPGTTSATEPSTTGTSTTGATEGTTEPTTEASADQPADGETTEPSDAVSGAEVTPGESSAPPSVPAPASETAGTMTVPSTAPAVRSSTIPAGSIVLSLVVLLLGALLLRTVMQREAMDSTPSAVPVAAQDDDSSTTQLLDALAADADATDPATLDFLLDLGRALVDAGDAINHVQATLEEVAAVNGVRDVGIVAIPTALIISLPGQRGVQTEAVTAGDTLLRLDQVEAVFRIVAEARVGRLRPTAGVAAVEAARAAPPPYSPRLQLLGHVLFTLGLVLLLRGGWPELALGAVLGALVGGLHLFADRLRSSYQPILPVVAALAVSVVVLSAARAVPGLEVFPPLVAALVAFLPGALLTTAVFELSTGQIVSGSGRLAAGALRLVLLALGILAGAQLVGVPATTVGGPEGGPVTVLAPWLGVAVFGVGVVLFKGARWVSLRWILLVLYVAYAGQVVGGLFVGSTLSAFVGALAMTPVALVAARQQTGPPALVSFLPGFWLLVPGAVGLQGVTQFLNEDTAGGVSSLVSMGTSMVGIALGVLLGLAIGAEVVARAGLLRLNRRSLPAG